MYFLEAANKTAPTPHNVFHNNRIMHPSCHTPIVLPEYITFLQLGSKFNVTVHPALYPGAPLSRCQHSLLVQSGLPCPQSHVYRLIVELSANPKA